MPSSQRSSSPSSQSSNPSASRRAGSSSRRNADRTYHRPHRYEVAHRPRRVIRAHAGEDFEPSNTGARDEAATSVENRARPRRATFTKKFSRMKFGPWEWLGLGASGLACLFLIREIAGVEGDHQMLRSQVAIKEAQLAAIDKQKQEEQKKLAYLQSEKGREQILAERGYLKPGDRILLFPAESQSETQAND